MVVRTSEGMAEGQKSSRSSSLMLLMLGLELMMMR